MGVQVIAELGNNHGGDPDICIDLIAAAARAGAHYVKLQRRHNQTLYTRAFYDSPYENENSYGPTYGLHREALELPLNVWVQARDYARSLGIDLIGTAFDHPSVDDLAHLGLPAIKIASGDLTNTPLISHAAQVGVPLIISTGGGEWTDVLRAVEAACDAPHLTVLHCTAAYPCDPSDLNLACIPTLRQRLYGNGWPGVEVGASLHDSGISSAVIAAMLGATMVEKHFTLNRAWRGTDHAFSLEPQGLTKLCRDLARVEDQLGSPIKAMLDKERGPIFKMRKSIYAARDVAAGTMLTRKDLKVCSPARLDALPPYLLDSVIGMVTLGDLHDDDPLFTHHLESFDQRVHSREDRREAVGH